MLRRCANVWSSGRDLIWVIVEDGPSTDCDVESLLLSTGISFEYFAVGPTRDKGHAQRNAAFELIKRKCLAGVVYNADDDNCYDARLLPELRLVRRVALLPVGNLGPSGIERPVVENGRIVGWDCGWLARRYPVDMAGFAFHSSLLESLASPLWFHQGVGGESEFLARLVEGPEDFELLCNNCADCYAWHNHNVPTDDT